MYFNHAKKNTLTISYADVQYQIGGNDCGLFAIAFAVGLANGTCPASVSYIQNELRDHFSECLQNQYLRTFHQDYITRNFNVDKDVSLEFCPYCFKSLGDSFTVCFNCYSKYHHECLNQSETLECKQCTLK